MNCERAQEMLLRAALLLASIAGIAAGALIALALATLFATAIL